MHMTRLTTRWVQLALFVLSLGLSAGLVAQPAPPSVKSDSGPWASGAGFDFDLGKKKLKKTRQSVSGMACNVDAAQQRICLLAFDEGAEARYAHVSQQALRIDAEPVVLRETTDELDAEKSSADAWVLLGLSPDIDDQIDVTTTVRTTIGFDERCLAVTVFDRRACLVDG